jgi:hypothetical protein
MPLHPAWVKNIARRVLWAALEKDITKEDRRVMQEFFAETCAYCGNPLSARWHADHLLSVDGGGFNHISNRVPACPRCNEDEKRDRDWMEFLKFKCGKDDALLEGRRKRIEEWTLRWKPAAVPVSEAQRAAWQREVDTLASAIDSAWKRLKEMKID